MGKHLRKRFSVEEVKEIFERYLSKEIDVEHVLALLKIKRSGFFKMLKSYREAPDDFSLEYKRSTPPRKLDAKSETGIMKELKKEAAIIRSNSNPVKFYNYSYLKETLEKKHKIFVSLPTIIRRAKKLGIISRGLFGSHMTEKS